MRGQARDIVRASHAVAWVAALLAMGCAPWDPMPTHRGGTGRLVGTSESPGSWTRELTAELRAMAREDQALRQGLGPETMTDTAFLGRMIRADSAHSLRLRALVQAHGWPSADVVGEDVAEDAFLIVQHTPYEAWQRAMLPQVEADVRAGALDPQDYALLFDRVQVHQGLPQRYGTQLDAARDGTLHLEPLEDPARVDSLRASLGLMPLDAYLDLAEASLGMKVARPSTGRN